MNSLESITPQQTGQLILKLKGKIDKVNEKVQKLEKRSVKYKNKLEILKNEKEYFKGKNHTLKEQNENLQEKNYKLECDVEDLMKFEKDFQKMVAQCEEKDMEILRLEDEVDTHKREIFNIERDFQR